MRTFGQDSCIAWTRSYRQWEEGFAYLKDFVEREGHANVKQKIVSQNGYPLGQWCGIQRFNNKNLSEDQRSRLESLPGWVWDKFALNWEIGFAHLQKFARQEGHTRVPRAFKTVEGFWLGSWAYTQKRKKAQEKLSADQLSKLEGLPGWTW